MGWFSLCFPPERRPVLHPGGVRRQRAEDVRVQHGRGQLPRGADHAQLWLGWRRQVWRTSPSSVYAGSISTLPRPNCLPSLSVLSLGCSIGYGYLHRVPRLLSGDGPAHASFREPSEGLAEVSRHVFSKKRISWAWHSFHVPNTLCSSGSSLRHRPNWSYPFVCSSATSHVFRPNRFTAYLLHFWPLQTKHDVDFGSVAVPTIPCSQDVPLAFSPASRRSGQQCSPTLPHQQSCLTAMSFTPRCDTHSWTSATLP